MAFRLILGGLILALLGSTPALAPAAAASAARLDAVCLPYVTHAEEDLCRIKIHPPLMMTEIRGDEGSRVEKEMRYVFGIFEHHILTHPEQWWLWNVLGGFGSPACPPS